MWRNSLNRLWTTPISELAVSARSALLSAVAAIRERKALQAMERDLRRHFQQLVSRQAIGRLRVAVQRRLAELREPTTKGAIGRSMSLGLALIAALVLGLGGWSALAAINGAVIAMGSVVVESNTKRVQHKEGGIVAEIHVKDGDRVNAGDLLIRLDNAAAHANLEIIQSQLDERVAHRARLEAERDGLDAIHFPQSLLSRQNEEEVEAVLASEQSIFAAWRSSRLGQEGQLREKASQLANEIAGLEAQQAAKALEIESLDKELEGLRALFKKGYVPNTRIFALERDRARIAGEEGQFAAEIARARGRISEVELEILQLNRDFLAEVVEALGETMTEIAELAERRVAAEDEVRRVEIRAPREGVVYQLAVHTVGGVVAPGETIMLIVPDEDSLIAEVRVSPNDIDQLHHGQRTVVRFPAFNRRTTPELNGVVETVSPDLTTDPQTGVAYYSVRIHIPDDELRRLEGLDLVPGMPVEAFIETGARTALSYLTKPLSDQVTRAFREE